GSLLQWYCAIAGWVSASSDEITPCAALASRAADCCAGAWVDAQTKATMTTALRRSTSLLCMFLGAFSVRLIFPSNVMMQYLAITPSVQWGMAYITNPNLPKMRE